MNESDSLLGGLDPEGIEQQAAGDCHGHEATQKIKGMAPYPNMFQMVCSSRLIVCPSSSEMGVPFATG